VNFRARSVNQFGGAIHLTLDGLELFFDALDARARFKKQAKVRNTQPDISERLTQVMKENEGIPGCVRVHGLE
jgi:hypothetical protein